MKKFISLLLVAAFCFATLPGNADNRYTAEMPILYQKGQSVFFGQYEQDNNLENGHTSNECSAIATERVRFLEST